MHAFVCPECFLQTRPHALYFSRNKTWWSVSTEEASLYRNLCSHRTIWPSGTILGCDSMRVAIGRWLNADPAARVGDTSNAASGAEEISIATVAAARHTVEQRAEYPVAISPVVGDSFRDPAARAAFQCNPGTAEIDGFDLRDVTLVAARLLLFHNGKRLKETRYLVDDHDYWMIPPMPRAVHEPDGGKIVVIGANLAFRNYYHWLMQCLPALDASVRIVGAANCVLALPPLSGWQEESLALLGYANLPRIQIEFDCHYRIARAHWNAYLGGAAEEYLSPRCLEVLDRAGASVGPVPNTPERIYVARLDSGNRVIRNEDAVRRLLEDHGFAMVIPGMLSFAAQIALFKGARFVVGGHGAGLTNVAFCGPGTTVLELIQSTYPTVFMNRVALAKGLRYHAECFECVAGGDVNQRDWLVDIDQLETKLVSIL